MFPIMENLFSFLFRQRSWVKNFSIYLLLLRLTLAYLLFQHAYFKIIGNDLFTPVYLDAFGVGVSRPMAVVLCIELFCSISFILGFLIRIFIIPMIGVAVYIIYLGIHVEQYMYSEVALLYLMAFSFLYLAGAGRYSVDFVAHHWIKLGI